MAYSLGGSTIKSPNSVNEKIDTQASTKLSINNDRYKDITGSQKKIWVLSWGFLSPTNYATIKTVFDDHITNGTTKAFVVNETNLTINATVNIEFGRMEYIKGGSYYSIFELILTEV